MSNSSDQDDFQEVQNYIELQLELSFQAFQKTTFTREQKLGRIRECCDCIIRCIDESKWS
jgi:hypothetical protein